MNAFVVILLLIDSLIGMVGSVLVWKGFSDKDGNILLIGTGVTVITSIIGYFLLK